MTNPSLNPTSRSPRWSREQIRAGNAIDFHVQILGLSFHDAMRQITGGFAP